jgi:hypothetical protein
VNGADECGPDLGRKLHGIEMLPARTNYVEEAVMRVGAMSE